MKTGTILYQVTGKRLMELVDEYFKDRNRLRSQALKFSKSVGGDPDNVYLTIYGDKTVFSGVIFHKAPDKKLWKRNDNCHPFVNGKRVFVGIPKRNSKQGKILYDNFKAVTEASLNSFKDAIGWKDSPYDQGNQKYIAFFNFFCTADEKFFGFAVPEINGEVPIKLNLEGCREISWRKYAQYFPEETDV